MKKISLPISLNRLVEKLEEKSEFTPIELQKIINKANISAEHLLPWADFDHPKDEGYGRKVIFSGEHFEIIVLSWAPRDFTAIHNNGFATWGAAQVFGKLEHISFRLEDNFLTTLHKEKLEEGDVISVNQNSIHQMGNPTDENVISVHIYGTPDARKNITERSTIYEIGKHETQLVNSRVYYDFKNEAIIERKPGLKADRLTEIGHYCSLLNFYHKSKVRGSQYNKAVNYFQNRSFEGRFSLELELDSKGILYFVELRKARILLDLLQESTKTIDSILNEINDLEKYS
jgi:cysteine dioxygenase